MTSVVERAFILFIGVEERRREETQQESTQSTTLLQQLVAGAAGLWEVGCEEAWQGLLQQQQK